MVAASYCCWKLLLHSGSALRPTAHTSQQAKQAANHPARQAVRHRHSRQAHRQFVVRSSYICVTWIRSLKYQRQTSSETGSQPASQPARQYASSLYPDIVCWYIAVRLFENPTNCLLLTPSNCMLLVIIILTQKHHIQQQQQQHQ